MRYNLSDLYLTVSHLCRCKIDEEVTHKAWLNRSNILFTGRDKWSLDKRVSLVNSNTSHFSIQIDQVHVADEGPYTCSFQANNKPRSAHVYLIVQGMYLDPIAHRGYSLLHRRKCEVDQ